MEERVRLARASMNSDQSASSEARKAFRFKTSVAVLLAFGAVLAGSRVSPLQDYALCSPAGKIYTVDAAHPNVECIVVSNTTIADVGPLGELKDKTRSAL